MTPKLQPAVAIDAALAPGAAPPNDQIDTLPGARPVDREWSWQLFEQFPLSKP